VLAHAALALRLLTRRVCRAVQEYSAWPTFPQLYVGGQFYGGCDITVAAFQDGSLKEALEAALAS
jgi:monothiol glutaredoxin